MAYPLIPARSRQAVSEFKATLERVPGRTARTRQRNSVSKNKKVEEGERVEGGTEG